MFGWDKAAGRHILRIQSGWSPLVHIGRWTWETVLIPGKECTSLTGLGHKARSPRKVSTAGAIWFNKLLFPNARYIANFHEHVKENKYFLQLLCAPVSLWAVNDESSWSLVEGPLGPVRIGVCLPNNWVASLSIGRRLMEKRPNVSISPATESWTSWH